MRMGLVYVQKINEYCYTELATMFWFTTAVTRAAVVCILSVCFGGLSTAVVHDVDGDVDVANVSRLINNERRLHYYLIHDYDRFVRPVDNESSPVHVSFELALTTVEDLDEQSQTLFAFAWVKMSWQDDQLKWDPDQFGGVTVMHIPPTELWIPDITLYNSNDAHFQFPTEFLTVVYSTGTVLWVPMVHLQIRCPVYLTYFPFDEQTCPIMFGSWTHSSTKLNLTTPHDGVLDVTTGGQILEIGTSEVEWEVTQVHARTNLLTYPCCPDDVYIDVTYTLTLKRHGSFAVHLFITPSVVLSLIIPTVFILPPDSREKMMLGVGILIGHVLLLGELIDYTHGIHHTVPLIVKYFLANIVLSCLSLFLSAIIVNIWNRSRTRCIGPPAFFRLVILGPVARVLCVNKELYTTSDGGGMDSLDPPHPTLVLSDGDDGVSASRDPVEDRGQLVHNYLRRAAMSEWRQVATVFDRLFLLLFFFNTVLLAISFTGYM